MSTASPLSRAKRITNYAKQRPTLTAAQTRQLRKTDGRRDAAARKAGR